MTDTPEGNGPAEGGTPAAEKSWFDGQSDDVVGYLQNRGLDKLSPAEAAFKTIEAHRAAEAKLGVPSNQLVRLPKNEEDAEGREALWKALGRPGEAKDYGLGDIPDVDQQFVDLFGPIAHSANLTKQQAQDVTRALAEFTAKNTHDEIEAQKAATAVEKQEIAKEWGQYAQANALTVEKAFEKLGFKEEEVGAIVNALGYKRTMSTFLEIGSKLGEDVFVTNQLPGGPGRYTPQGARDRIEELKRDTAWTQAYLNGDTAKIKEFSDLHRLANGG